MVWVILCIILQADVFIFEVLSHLFIGNTIQFHWQFSSDFFVKETVVFQNMSGLFSLVLHANSFLCDWVIAGICNKNDKEVKSRRFCVPEGWSTWVSWVKSQLWCATQSVVFLTKLDCCRVLFHIVKVVLNVFSVFNCNLNEIWQFNYFCFLRFQGVLWTDEDNKRYE